MADNDFQLHFDAGNRASNQERWGEAIAAYRAALALAPDHEWANNNLGFCLAQAGQLDEAALYLRRAIAKSPDNFRAHANLVMALERGGQRLEAVSSRRRLTQLQPEVFDFQFHLANTMLAHGRIGEALHYYRRALELSPQHTAAISNYLLATNYADQLSPEEVAGEHFRLAQRWGRPRRPFNEFANSRDPDRPLRIGLLSTDYGNHPVGKILAALLAAHDRQSFKLYAYADRETGDEWTARITHSCDQYLQTHDWTDPQLEERILADEIDILIELNGHTSGRNRLGVLAGGAAPIQIAFLGYPNTTGSTAVDYRLTDRFCDPPGQTERLHSEQLVRLSRGFLCFQPPAELPPLVPDPQSINGHFAFGSFNNPSKISHSALQAWGTILRGVPDSRLVVKYGGAFQQAALREQWRAVFASQGVDARRLEFLDPLPRLEDHLRVIGGVDLALDPFPYQGTMTSLETLSMGVPVLTLAGATYARRASSALLLRLGVDELVTASAEEYARRGIELALQPARLRRLREGLREKFLASTICDVRGYAQELEQTYRRLWRQWCQKHPRDFSLEPLNGQQRRQDLFRALLRDLQFDLVVETGTFVGVTAQWLASQTSAPVYTVETSPRLAQSSAWRLSGAENVLQFFGDSRGVLRRLARDPTLTARKTFFYLDAHAAPHLPLAEELQIVFSSWPRCLVAIDDCQIPHDVGYLYDNYGGDKRIAIDSVRSVLPGGAKVFYPATPSSAETGARRGCALIAQGDELLSALRHFDLLEDTAPPPAG